MTKITSKTVRGRSADELNSKDNTKYIWTESGLGANTFIVDKDTVSSALNLTGLTGDVINIDGYSGDYTARLTNSILTLQTNDQTITVSLAKNSIITLQFTDSSKEVDLKNKTLNLVDIDGKTLYSQSLATKSGVLHIDGFTSYQALHQDSLIATAVKTALTDIKNINYKTVDEAILSNDKLVIAQATTVALTDTSGIKYNNLTDFKKLILTDTAKIFYPTVDDAIKSNDVTVINDTVKKLTGFPTLADFNTAYNKLLNPLPTFSVTGSSQVTEGNNASFVVHLENQGTTDCTVKMSLGFSGGATLGVDFSNLTVDAASFTAGVRIDAVNNTLTIPASANISDVTLTTLVTPDVFIEKGEKLSLTLSPANSNAAVSTTKNTVTTDINDPQILPSFDVTPGGQVKEGGIAIFKIILSNLSSASEYSVKTTLLGDGGATLGTDFVGTLELSKTSKDAGILFNSTSGLLTIPKNVNVSSVELQTQVNTDLETEIGEKLSLILSSPSSNAVLGNQTSKIAITESNPPTFTIKALNANAQVEEKSIAQFKIDLKDYKSTDEYTVNIKVDGINVEHELNPLTKPINANTSIANTTVNPLTLELNASLPGLIDFVDETKLTTQSLNDESIKAGVTLNAGVLKIPANTGISSVVLSIPILPDQVTLEKDEGIKLTLSLPTPTPTNYIVGDASTALMTIIDKSDISPVLTSGADILFGTYGDTSFTSELLTLNAGDSVIDSSTTDKDKIKITTNFPLFTATATPTITNIETINLTALNNLDMDMTKITGVQNFNSINSTATIKLTKIADAKMALGLSGSNINTINANYSSIAAPTATADKLTVNLDAAIDANVTVNSGFEYAELNVVNDSTLRLFDVQLKPITGILTISGTGKLTVWDHALEDHITAGLNNVNNIEFKNTNVMQFGDIGTSGVITTYLSTFKAPTNTGGIVTGIIQGATTGLTMQLGDGKDNIKEIRDKSVAPATPSAPQALNDIRLGAGDDTLKFIRSGVTIGGLPISLGNTYISGGEGNDLITISSADYLDVSVGTLAVTVIGGNSDILDTIDGGSGNDTLSIDTSITPTSITGNIKNALDFNKIISNFEVLKVTGIHDVTLAANVSPTVFDFSDTSKNIFTLNPGYTNATVVNIASGDQIVNSANVGLTINLAAVGLVAATSITGGTGTDTINLTADGSNSVLSNITRIDSIMIVDGGNDTTSGLKPAGKDVNLDLGTYATPLTINASALGAGTITNGIMGLDDETLFVDGLSAITSLNIIGGAGRDTIKGGSGNDTINGGAGDDLIIGGAGDDVIDMGTNLTTSDTIDGGAGTDTLVANDAVLALILDNTVSNITNMEVLGLTSTQTLTAPLRFNIIKLTTNLTDLTFGNGYTGATTVQVQNNRVYNTANIPLTVEFSAAFTPTVTGGTGIDTLNITADNGTANIFSKTTSIESIIIIDGGDGAASGKDVTLNLTDYATKLNINASALDSNNEILTIVGASNSALTVTGGAGNDIIVGSTECLNTDGDSLVGGDGDDSFTMANYLTSVDTIIGGNGNDILNTTNTITDAQFTHISSMETLDLKNTAILGPLFDQSSISKINVASNYLVDAQTTTIGHLFVVSSTDALDQITGGSGNDIFSFSGVNQLRANDIINGTSGNDSIRLDNSTGGVTAAINLSTVTNIDNVTVYSNGGNVDLTFSNSSSSTINVDATAITNPTYSLTMHNSVNSSTTSFSITGGAGNDTLIGSSGADTFTGGLGADFIDVGASSASVHDRINFYTEITRLESNSTSMDWIKNATFNGNQSTLLGLTVSVATVGATVSGSVSSASFVSNMNTLLNVSGFGFDKSSAGSLINSGGSISAAIVVANAGDLIGKTYLAVDLDGSDTFTASDFVIEITGSTITSLTTSTFLLNPC